MWAARALLAALCAAAAARAEGSATTLFDSRPRVRDGGTEENRIYQSFAFSVRAPDQEWLQDFRFVVRGWGRLTLGPVFDDRVNADLDSAFVEGRMLERRLLLRLGRQLVTGGAVRAAQLDGASVRALAGAGLGFDLWGGVPVQPRFGTSWGDALAGGRVFWRRSFDSEIGASFVYSLRGHELSREDVAIDGSWSPLRPLNLSGLLQWNLEERRLAEGRGMVLWQVAPSLQLSADAQRTAPSLFLDRSSIFAVFSDERRDEAGGEVVWRAIPALSLSGDLHWLSLQGGEGWRAALTARFRTVRGDAYGAELRLLTQPDNGYKQARLFAVRRLRYAITLSVDLDAFWLEREINLSKRSFTGTLTAAWAFARSWEAMLAGSLGSTPLFERRAEVIARLVWKFGWPGAMR